MKKLIQNIVPITVILFISNLGHILYANSVKSYRQDRHSVMTTVASVDSLGNTIYTQKPTTKVTTRNYIGDFIKTGNYTWEVPTDDGHIFIDTRNKIKTHYYYVRDYLGSTRAVVDTAGVLLQTMNYYPSGVPFSRMEQESVTDRLHTGKPFLDMSGLGYYDNNARFLDILTGGFISRDALAGSYPHLSPYANCANNPLIYTDPTGKYLIDEKGKRVSYNPRTKTWSSNVTPAIKEVGEAMMLTKEGTRILTQMRMAKHPITINFKDDLDKNKYATTSSKTYTTKYGNGIVRRGYVKADIYISKKNIETSITNDSRYKGLSNTEIIGLIGTHEGVHATNINALNHVVEDKNKAENIATESEELYIKERREAKQKFEDEKNEGL